MGIFQYGPLEFFDFHQIILTGELVVISVEYSYAPVIGFRFCQRVMLFIC